MVELLRYSRQSIHLKIQGKIFEVNNEVGKTDKKPRSTENLLTDESFTIKLDVNFCHLAEARVREAGLQKCS